MNRALGISVHTGWAACVVVGGSLRQPEIVANEIVQVLPDAERFCFHTAAKMSRLAAPAWIERMRNRALESARRSLMPLINQKVSACAVVGNEGDAGDLAEVLAAHPRIHRAEGFFYRDVFRDALRIARAASLDTMTVGKLGGPLGARSEARRTGRLVVDEVSNR